jgi:hypothetical protein
MGGCLYVNGISPNPTDADTIHVSLMSPVPPYALVERQTVILHTDGTTAVGFGAGVTVGNSYYIRIEHRNALETWSQVPQVMNSITSYDFTTAASKAYGGNMIDVGSPLLESAKWAIYSGDISDFNSGNIGVQDDVVESQDYLDLENAVSVILLGYNFADLTGDGIVESADYLIMENNVSNIVYTIRP